MKKIKKGCVYRLPTKKTYDDFMKTAERQGFVWIDGSKPTEDDVYPYLERRTCVNVDENGLISLDVFSFDMRKSKLEKWEIENEPPTIVEHLIRGNKTIVKLSNGKVGVARCHPDDTFDIYEGLRVATARAYGKPVEEPKRDVLRVVCTCSTRPEDFAVGKVYERVNGVLTDDRGYNWYGPCWNDDPRRWVFSMANFELYEEPVEAPAGTISLSLDSSYVDLQQRVKRLETAVIALTGRVNEHTRELKPWKRGKHE